MYVLGGAGILRGLVRSRKGDECMKRKKQLRNRLTAILTAVLIGFCVIAVRHPAATRQDAADTVFAATEDSFSESCALDDILKGETEEESDVREAFRLASDFPEEYRELGYQAFYTKGLESGFIFVYRDSEIRLREAVTSPEGLVWAANYEKYLSALSRMTGVCRKYLICVFNTDLPSNAPGVNHENWFHISQEYAYAAAGGILNNRFTHTFLHETAHSFHVNFYKMMFNSEEEVFVNLRMICAMHWAGLDSESVMMTNATSKWTWADPAVDSKYHIQDADLIALQDPAYQDYYPEGSRLYDLWDMKTTFVPMSLPQNIAFAVCSETASDRYLSRLALILNTAADKPVFLSAKEDPSDRNNWLNTDAVAENWASVTEEEWEQLSVLCISDIKQVSLPSHTENLVRMFYAYQSRCTEELRYFCLKEENGKKVRNEYTVSVTPTVKRWISESCDTEGDVFCISGNLIQACNVFDYLGVDIDSAEIRNPNLNTASTVRNFCLKNLTPDRETSHAYILTVAEPMIIVQPADADASIGDTVSFYVDAVGGEMSFQWQFNNGSGWRDSTMDGADTQSVSKEVLEGRDGQQYRCIITLPNGEELISEAATLRIRPTITVQPADTETAYNEKAVFSVAANGRDLSYQWEYNSGRGWNPSTAAGAKSASVRVTATAAHNGHLYRCVITGGSGAQTVSESAVLNVIPALRDQPENVIAEAGENAVFRVSAFGKDLSYCWQYSDGSEWTDADTEGADSDALSVLAEAELDGRQYRCIISLPNGNQVISDIAVLKILSESSELTENPPAETDESDTEFASSEMPDTESNEDISELKTALSESQ